MSSVWFPGAQMQSTGGWPARSVLASDHHDQSPSGPVLQVLAYRAGTVSFGSRRFNPGAALKSSEIGLLRGSGVMTPLPGPTQPFRNFAWRGSNMVRQATHKWCWQGVRSALHACFQIHPARFQRLALSAEGENSRFGHASVEVGLTVLRDRPSRGLPQWENPRWSDFNPFAYW